MTTLQENIAARERAESLIELAGEESLRFWEELARLAAEKLPPKPAPIDPLAPMNNVEAIHFENGVLEFGKHAGEQIGCVPSAYIGWLAENEFGIKVRRYVKSERFKQRQDQEESSE